MKRPFQVRCREATYDIDNEMLVLLCFFEEFGECRIVHFPRSDFHFKYPKNEVPHIEMHKTAALFKGKRFKLVIADDPNRNREIETSPYAMQEDFTEQITKQWKAVEKKFTDPQLAMARRLGSVIERDLKRQKSMGNILADEMVIRARLKDVNFGE